MRPPRTPRQPPISRRDRTIANPQRQARHFELALVPAEAAWGRMPPQGLFHGTLARPASKPCWRARGPLERVDGRPDHRGPWRPARSAPHRSTRGASSPSGGATSRRGRRGGSTGPRPEGRGTCADRPRDLRPWRADAEGVPGRPPGLQVTPVPGGVYRCHPMPTRRAMAAAQMSVSKSRPDLIRTFLTNLFIYIFSYIGMGKNRRFHYPRGKRSVES